MESKDLVSSCLDKDEQELQRLCQIKKEMKNNFDNIFHNFQTCIHGLRPDWFHQSRGYTFQFIFGEKFDSFKNIFDHNIDQLKKQLDKEELHECDYKTYLSNLVRQKKKFQEYAHYDTESLKKKILSYLNEIEKGIDARARHEEELRRKERMDNEKREKLKILLYTHLEFLSGIDSENTCSSGGFQRAFRLFFEEEEVSMVVFKVFKNQFQKFITTQISMDYDDSLANRFFTAYTLCDAQMVNERTIQTQEGIVNMVKDKGDVGLVVTESSRTELGKQNGSSRSGNDTWAKGVDIRLSNDTKQLNEVQSTAAYNVFVNDKQHAEQPKYFNEGGVD
ncbi:hypothetical protein Tco_0354942 [Tanacetum coccineum]